MRTASRKRNPETVEPRVQELLGRWLLERQSLMSALWELAAALRRSGGQNTLTLRPQLDAFCEVLVDYVSAGHFEVFRELLEQHERRGTGEEGRALYRLILPTTQVALDFNDRYFRGGSGIGLERDLSRVGQLLASRFDWEDALLRGLRSHTQAIA